VRKPALRDGRREDVTGVKKSSRSSSSETKETKTAAQLLTARHTQKAPARNIFLLPPPQHFAGLMPSVCFVQSAAQFHLFIG
jgi:hypothetical protein